MKSTDLDRCRWHRRILLQPSWDMCLTETEILIEEKMQYQSCKIGERPTCLETKIILDPLRDRHAKIYTPIWMRHSSRYRVFFVWLGSKTSSVSRVWQCSWQQSASIRDFFREATWLETETGNAPLHCRPSVWPTSDELRPTAESQSSSTPSSSPSVLITPLFLLAAGLMWCSWLTQYPGAASSSRRARRSWPFPKCIIISGRATWLLHRSRLLPRLSRRYLHLVCDEDILCELHAWGSWQIQVARMSQAG